jgi:predicted nucleotidyltransferase
VNGAPAGSITVLRCVVGSTSHGTNVEAQDDRDEMEIVVEPREYVVGLRQWETSVVRTKPDGVRSGPGDLDLVVHSLRKFARLAAKGNPTILIPLFATGKWVIHCGELGYRLKNNRWLFLSRAIGGAFLGYMRAQRERMAGERGGRHGAMRTELVEQYGFDTKYAGHVIRLGYQGVELLATGAMTMPMREHERRDVVDVRTGKWSLEKVLTVARELEQALLDEMATSPLPPEPDTAAIDRLLISIYEDAWRIAK